MPIFAHHLHNLPELLEVYSLLRLQLVLFEERDDALEQMILTPHAIGQPVAMVPTNHSATEKGFQRMECLNIAFVLHDGELR